MKILILMCVLVGVVWFVLSPARSDQVVVTPMMIEESWLQHPTDYCHDPFSMASCMLYGPYPALFKQATTLQEYNQAG